MTATTTSMCELNSRLSDGIEVQLMWCKDDNRLWVAVSDARKGEAFVLPVADGERAMDVFHHPFAYAAHHGISPEATPAMSPPVPVVYEAGPEIVHASDADATPA